MKNEIKVLLNNKQVTIEKGTVLSEIIKGEKPCGGHGKCGKCKVVAKGNISQPTETELALLSSDEIANGVRLSCLAYALGDCEIHTFYASEESRIQTSGVLPESELKPLFSRYGVAVDIGTTTLVARLYNTDGVLLAQTSRLNPQSEWGADVISRIEAALDGKEELLSQSIRNAIDGMIYDFADVVDINGIDAVVITGNTVMLSLLTMQSVEPFSHAPFDVKQLFGETFTAKELSLSALNQDTAVYLPPCISAFVGADITCAILATELCNKNTALLVDIGTNGEMALWHNGILTVCSTAAGPAFEGVGITMGMQGVAGAIDRVYTENGILHAHVIGEGEAVGICGSGLVDAVACMLELGVTDESGYLDTDEFIIKDRVYLTPKDIRMFQLAKSAICAGILTMADFKKLKSCDIPSVFIAGGFGNYLNKEHAASIGLLPTGISEIADTVGNAALSGATTLLLNRDMQKTAESIAKRAKTLDLSVSPVFSEKYAYSMMLEKSI